MSVSIIVPVLNGAQTLRPCLDALMTQSLPRDDYEVIVVDDGSRDHSGEIARDSGAFVITQPNRGAPAARNAGVRASHFPWVAFTDADCIPSRNWLKALLESVVRHGDALGAAGKTLGYESRTAAARFVDLTGGLDAEHHLAHPAFPFAPSGNLLYRREFFEAAGGFDERYATYDACDLHTRLRARFTQPFLYVPRALVLHRHRATWKAYWKQQFGYGVGYAQFMWAHRNEAAWTPFREVQSLGRLAADATAAVWPATKGADTNLLRRGTFVRHAAQHAGFLSTYYRPAERKRW